MMEEANMMEEIGKNKDGNEVGGGDVWRWRLRCCLLYLS